jgi:hypothetical protein
MDLFEEIVWMRRAGQRGALATRRRCAIRLRLVVSKSQRTRDTGLLQQVGLSSFLMNRLLDAFDEHAVQNCTDPRLRRRYHGPRLHLALVGTSQACGEGVQEIIL